MTTSLPALRDGFGLSVAVVGDVMLDVYLEGTANRLCREAPVPVVRLDARTDLAGAAGNTALAVCDLGASNPGAGPVTTWSPRRPRIDARCVRLREAP